MGTTAVRTDVHNALRVLSVDRDNLVLGGGQVMPTHDGTRFYRAAINAQGFMTCTRIAGGIGEVAIELIQFNGLAGDNNSGIGWIWAFGTYTEAEFFYEADVVVFMRNTVMPHGWARTGATDVASNPFRF